MQILEIIFSNAKVAAITISEELYFIRLDPFMPEVYDGDTNRMNISNIDTWINHETMQQYSYKQLIEICEAYHKGYNANAVNQQPKSFIVRFVRSIIKHIFTSELAAKYANDYWIECTPSSKLSTKIISPIMKKHEILISKLGKRTFEDYANRIRKSAVNNTDAGGIDKMFDKLQLSIREPSYPDTLELDRVIINIMIKEIDLYTYIPKDIMTKLEECEKKFA